MRTVKHGEAAAMLGIVSAVLGAWEVYRLYLYLHE